MYDKVDFAGEHPCSVVSTAGAGERKIQVLQACNPKNSACGNLLRVMPNRELPYKNQYCKLPSFPIQAVLCVLFDRSLLSRHDVLMLFCQFQ